MEREEIEQVAEEFAQRRYINGCAVPTGNMISKSIACREGFKSGAQWQRNHVWRKTDEIPKLKKDILVHFESGNMVTMYVDKEILDKFKKYYVDYWAYIDDLMPTSFDDILEDNKDVLQRLRDNQNEQN